MAGRPRSIDDSKIFDVSKPGKSKPMGTSRPVIVNHGAMVKDQTVNGTPKEEPMSAPSVVRKTIKPVTITDGTQPKDEKPTEEPVAVTESTSGSPELPVELVEEPAETASVEEKAAELEDTETTAEDTKEVTEQTADKTEEVEAPVEEIEEADEKPAEDESPTEDIEPPAGSDSASVDAMAQESEKKKLNAKEEEEQVKKEAALQEMIDSKKYVVPVSHDSGKGGHKAIWALIILILIAAGAYLAVDAKVIKNNIALPYEVFKEKTEPETVVPVVANQNVVTLTQSGLKIPFDPAIWSPQTPVVDTGGSSVSIMAIDKSVYNYYVTAYELKKTTTTDTTTTSKATITPVGRQQLNSGGKTNLYFYKQVRSYTISKGTFYQPECGIGAYATADATGDIGRVPVDGKEYTLHIFCSMTGADGITPVRFTTMAEAQNWFVTSNEFKNLEALLTTARY